MVPRLIRQKLERLESNINKMQSTIDKHCPKERHVVLTKKEPKGPKLGQRIKRMEGKMKKQSLKSKLEDKLDQIADVEADNVNTTDTIVINVPDRPRIKS